MQALPPLPEIPVDGKSGNRCRVRFGKGASGLNLDWKFTNLNLSRRPICNMEVEEAIIVGLLALGMSILVAVTVMLFW